MSWFCSLKLAESFFNPTQVSYLIQYVTNRCNFRCSFCFYYNEVEKGKKNDELTVDEFRKLSKNLGPIIQLSFGGGEPFIREDLAEITGIFIKNNFVRYLTIPTNASLTKKIETYLENVLPKYPDTYFRIVFSIEGIGDEHDKYRSASGSYKKICESYAVVGTLRKKYKNLVLDSNSVYTADSEGTLLKTIQTISNEFNFDNISITYARGDIKDVKLKEMSTRKYLEIDNYLQELKRKKEKRFLYPVWRGVRDVSREYLIKSIFFNEFVSPCVAGKKLLIIGETGDVYPCEILKQSMGNIRDYNYDVKKLLSQKKNKMLIKWIKESKCKCSFECALAANVVWGKFVFFRIFKSTIKNIGK